MYFKDFAYQIGLVMKGNSTTSSFTHTLFDAILPEKKKNLLDGISENTYKAYYNGKTKITGIAKKFIQMSIQIYSKILFQSKEQI
ncbi:MAG: hypothetical protein IJQ57_09640 [Synergistaceae bacterium]|nr:hypothetical protein [Synergistaceae bacterium]MBR0253598.1 hypothetical protein [Synergistaceae bacterium]